MDGLAYHCDDSCADEGVERYPEHNTDDDERYHRYSSLTSTHGRVVVIYPSALIVCTPGIA